MNLIIRFCVSTCILFLSVAVFAEKADRDKPVNLEADRITVDDAKKVNILEGNVQLTQGTLVIRSDKIVVTQDADGFQSGIATGGSGGLARFRQRREGRDEYVEGEAERVVYDGRADKTEFFLRARIKSGHDEVRGQYVVYDGKNETYMVTSSSGGSTTTPLPGRDGRVRAVIQPKKKSSEDTSVQSGTETPPLKTAPAIIDPRKE